MNNALLTIATHGIKVKDVAAACGMQPTEISSYLHGSKHFGADREARIADTINAMASKSDVDTDAPHIVRKTKRIKLGLSQKEMRVLIGVSAATISGIEKGNRYISRDVLERYDNAIKEMGT